jgi:YVTN family beta-propeller protein
MMKANLSTGFPVVFTLLALVVLDFVPLTGSAQQTASDSLKASAGLPKNVIVAAIPLGPLPNAMVVSPDSNYVYVSNFVSTSNIGIVQVIATATNTITATITLGTGNGYFPNTLAISPDGGTLYVSEFDGPTIWVIDTATQQINTTMNSGFTSQGMAVTPDGAELYICNGYNASVTVIDTATLNSNTIQVGKNNSVWDVVFTPDGSKAYITSEGLGPFRHLHSLAVVDTATESVVKKIAAQGTEAGEVMTTTGKRLFLSTLHSIAVINTFSNLVVRTLTQTFAHLPAVITPDGKFLYMVSGTNRNIEQNVTMIKSASGLVAGNQIVLPFTRAIAIAPNGKFAYVFANVQDGGPGGLYVVDISP